MTQPTFDAEGALHFDLARGNLLLDGKVPAIAVPASALDALFKRAPADIVEGFGKRLGNQAADLVRSRVGDKKLLLDLESVNEQLGGALALLGLGDLEIERWGRALVVKLKSMTLRSGHVAIARSAVEATLFQLFERPLKAVAVSHDETSVKLVVVAPEVAAKVESWVVQGLSFAELLDKLHVGTDGVSA